MREIRTDLLFYCAGRRRKVRCDEGLPTCANCIRLRLECVYTSSKHKHAMPAKYTANANDDELQTGSQSSPTDVDHMQHQSGLETIHSVSSLPYGNQGVLWNFENETAAGFGRAFQDVFFSLDNFDVGADFANSDAFLGPEFLPDSHGASQNENVQTAYDTNHQHWSAGVGNGKDYREKTLIEHFVRSPMIAAFPRN